jgi:hypothetical protein
MLFALNPSRRLLSCRTRAASIWQRIVHPNVFVPVHECLRTLEIFHAQHGHVSNGFLTTILPCDSTRHPLLRCKVQYSVKVLRPKSNLKHIFGRQEIVRVVSFDTNFVTGRAELGGRKKCRFLITSRTSVDASSFLASNIILASRLSQAFSSRIRSDDTGLRRFALPASTVTAIGTTCSNSSRVVGLTAENHGLPSIGSLTAVLPGTLAK